MKKTGVAALALSTLLAGLPINAALATSPPASSQQTAPDYDPTDIPDDIPSYSPELDESLYGEDGGGGASNSGTTPTTPSTGQQQNGGTTGTPKPGTTNSTTGTPSTTTPGATEPDATAPAGDTPVQDEEGANTDGLSPVTEEGTIPTTAPSSDIDGEDKELPVIDKTNQVEKGGFFLSLSGTAFESTDIIPTFELQLWNAETNKKLSTVLVGAGHYKKDQGAYQVKFDVPQGYKLGDKFAILLGDKRDPEVASLTFSVFDEEKDQFLEYTLDGMQYVPVTASAMWYETDKNQVYRLYGSNAFPVSGGVRANIKDAVFRVTDKSGVPLRGVTLDFEGVYGSKMKKTSVKTDSAGVARIAKSSLDSAFFVSSENRKVVGASDTMYRLTLPSGGEEEWTQPAIYELQLEGYSPKTAAVVDNTSTSGTSGVQTEATATVNFNISGNADLSKAWQTAQLSLTDKAGKEQLFDVTPSNNVLYGLTDGAYTVKVIDNGVSTASVSSSTLTVSGGKGVVNLSLAPKYVLQVDKDGAPYSFSVLNVDNIADKKYTGSAMQVFGVVPGESYMVNDNESAENGALNVIIEEGSYVTHVILGVGVVKGGTASASSPHTGDTIWYWGGALLLSGAALAYLLVRRKKGLGLEPVRKGEA